MITREWAFTVGFGHHKCPQCRADEIACSVWDEGGYKLVKCHRASCGAFAKYPLDASITAVYGSGQANVFTPTVYRGDRVLPREGDRRRFYAQFGFQPDFCYFPGYTHPADELHLILPIRRADGSDRGVQTAVYGARKERKTYKQADEPMIHWTHTADHYDGVWLVEDIISAEKLHKTCSVRAVALLGTHLSTDAAAEISRETGNITIALDADATVKAFEMARRWGPSFVSCRVQVLKQDIKDMSRQEIENMVGFP